MVKVAQYAELGKICRWSVYEAAKKHGAPTVDGEVDTEQLDEAQKRNVVEITLAEWLEPARNGHWPGFREVSARGSENGHSNKLVRRATIF